MRRWRPPTELPDLRRMDTLALDTETKDDRLRADMGSGWPTRSGYLCGASVAFRTEGNVRGLYFPIRHPDSENFAPEQVYQWVRDHVAAGVHFVTQNGSYDWGWLRAEAGIKMPPGERLEEIGALATMVDENRFNYRLESLCAWRELSGKDDELLREGITALGLDTGGKRKKLVPQSHIWQLPAHYVGPYAEADAINTLLLFESLDPVLDHEGTRAAYRLECDILPMVQAMRLRGIRLDFDAAEQAGDQCQGKRDAALAELSEKLGAAVSMHEVHGRKWLEETFDHYKIKYPLTDKGNPSFKVGKNGWMWKHEHWLPPLIATVNKYDKAAGYVQTLIDYADNGRIHAEINPHRSEDSGAKSSRFSISHPPLQQMPSRDAELAPLIRGIFLPEEGEFWAKPDVSQQEFRLVVHYANQHKLEGAAEVVARYLADPATNYHAIAAERTGLDYSDAKNSNFAKIYGAGVDRFAEMINKPLAEAQRIYDRIDSEMPFLRLLSNIYGDHARKDGYIVLYDGARRHFERYAPAGKGKWKKGAGPCEKAEAKQRLQNPNHPWYGRGQLNRADTYTALNALIQGSAARHTKLWMRACWREGIVPLLQMHDCLDCSVSSREQAELVARLGCEAIQLDVPMLVDLKYGRTWGDAKHTWEELQGGTAAEAQTAPATESIEESHPIEAAGDAAPRNRSAKRTPKAATPRSASPRGNGSDDSNGFSPDPISAMAFLRTLRPAGPWVLTAIIPDGATETRTFDATDEDSVIRFIATNNPTKNLYFTGNLCGRRRKKPTKADMVGAIFLHTDDDPRDGETPAAAKTRIRAAYDNYEPRPSLVIDSGNGLQGLWLLDTDYLFNGEQQIADIESRNKALAADLGTTPGTHNVDRLLRLPGTINHPNKAKLKKGRTTCMAHAVQVTDARYTLTTFATAAADTGAKQAASGGNGAGVDADSTELPPLLRSLLAHPDHGAGQATGGYKSRSELAFAFITAALHRGVERATIAAAILAADSDSAIHAHCAEQPGGAAAYIERQIEHAQEKTGEAGSETLESARASTFEMEALDWFWANRFALGKIGLIVGLPDEGKGQLLCYMVAQTTQAGAWPCDEGHAPQGNVVFFTAEDAINDTVAPRLAAAGADRDRVEIVKMVRGGTKDRMFNLATDLDLLRRKIFEVGDVRMVLIDPISAYLGVGKVDSFRTTDVRAVLGPLVELAAELRVAVVAVMHFNKKIDITNALLRISDSLAFAAVARHVYGVIDDTENDRKLLVRAKNNVAAKSRNQTLAFRFEAREVGADRRTGKPIWAPYIVFEDAYVDVSAMEAMQAAASNKSPTTRDTAKKFLFDLLSGGPVPSGEIEEAADANGISTRTLSRAKADLKVFAKKDKGKDGLWRWQLPDDLAVKPSKSS